MSDSFRSFLSDVQDRLFDDKATILEPESPPNWSRLGWKTGWIVEEAHTGPQWWLTDEHEWRSLSSTFGQSKRQKNQAFSRWYSSLLDEYRRDLGVPLKLDTVRWRQMDLGAFEGRPLIQEQDWWSIEFEGGRSGSWHLIVAERFIAQFEEVEDAPEPDPPWTFLDVWESVGQKMKQDLLGCIGRETGSLNHLGALVLAGRLERETLEDLMARKPSEDLEQVLRDRRNKLNDLSEGHERQALDQWKDDAVKHLTDRVGEWLLEDELSGEGWSSYREEWSGYRVDVLEGTFGSDSWAALWNNLHSRDIKRVVPRLNREQLAVSLVQVHDSVRDQFEEALPERQVRMILDEPPATRNHLEVLKSREAVYRQLRETISDIDYELVGRFDLRS